MGIVTYEGNVLTDEDLEAMAKRYEAGEWPEGMELRDDTPRVVNVTLPAWMVEAADREARRLSVPRKSVLNMWIARNAEEALRVSPYVRSSLP